MRNYQQGQLQAAESGLRDLLAIQPSHGDAWLLLGIIYARTERWNDSESVFSRLLPELPHHEGLLFWFAQTKRNLGDYQSAISLCGRALERNPANLSVLNELSLSYMAVNLPAARETLSRALELAPSTAHFHLNMGITLRRMSLLRESRSALEQAIRLEPDLRGAVIELGEVLEILGADRDMIELLAPVYDRHPRDTQLGRLLANAYANNGLTEKAEEIFRKCVVLEPRSANAFGFWLQQAGRFSESVKCFQTSASVHPEQGAAYYGLAEAKVFDIDGISVIEQTRKLVESNNLALEELTYLNYALASAHEQLGHYQRSMEFFDRANEGAYQLYNAARPFDQAARHEHTNKNLELYSSTNLATIRKGASESVRPIFIVGMIRSGTTLLEQLLLMHADVGSAGEPVYWIQEADRIGKSTQGVLTQADIEDLAGRFLNHLDRICPGRPRVIDKMPLNYSRIGLIRTVFPQAKIIHLRRNPLDTCLSIYTTYFGQGPNFAYKSENIVFNYLEYLRYMAHWRTLMSKDTYLEIDYETLVVSPTEAISRVMQFCELRPNLDSASVVSAIRTPSVWQARQPVYKRSINRWQLFEPWLGDLAVLKGITHPSIASNVGQEL